MCPKEESQTAVLDSYQSFSNRPQKGHQRRRSVIMLAGKQIDLPPESQTDPCGRFSRVRFFNFQGDPTTLVIKRLIPEDVPFFTAGYFLCLKESIQEFCNGIKCFQEAYPGTILFHNVPLNPDGTFKLELYEDPKYYQTKSPYVVIMKKLPGETVVTAINNAAKETPEAPMKMFSIAIAISKTLKEFHAKDLVNGDFKPDNVLISFDDDQQHCTCSLIDLGASRKFGEQTFRFKGAHIAPEVRGLSKPADPNQDIYSFGVMLYTFFLMFYRNFIQKKLESDRVFQPYFADYREKQQLHYWNNKEAFLQNKNTILFLAENCYPKEMKPLVRLFELSQQMMDPIPTSRPTMDYVIGTLESIKVNLSPKAKTTVTPTPLISAGLCQ